MRRTKELKPRVWHRYYDHNVPTTIRYPRFPVQSLVHIAAAQFPHKPAINLYGTELTFTELRAQVLRMTNALGRLNVRKGDRVGLAMSNSTQYIIDDKAAISLGAVVVNVDPFYTHADLPKISWNHADHQLHLGPPNNTGHPQSRVHLAGQGKTAAENH